MYYYNEEKTDINDLITDFLNFKKSKKQPEIDIHEYKPLEIIKEFLQAEVSALTEYTVKDEKDLEQNLVISKKTECECVKDLDSIQDLSKASVSDCNDDIPITIGCVPDSEQEYINMLYTETNKRLLPYVEEALNSYEFDGSPVYAEMVEKEMISKIVDKSIELASKSIYEINDIQREMHRHPWTPNRVLKACVESLVLNELFYRRKLMYTSIPNFKDFMYI